MKKLFILILLLFISFLGSCSDGYYSPMGYGRHMMDFGYGFGGVFMWILFLIVIGVLIYFIITGAKSKKAIGFSDETPLDILKKRYAKGEITKEEFDRIKNDL